LQHPGQVPVGGRLELAMKWQNVGSAPCYRPYRLAYRLANETGTSKVLVGSIAVNRWLPGSIELFTDEFFQDPKDLPPGVVADVPDTIQVPADFPVGTYTLSIGIVDGEPAVPRVRLGIAGRDADGWYPLSKITVVKAKAP
jgi:hypothetical protein